MTAHDELRELADKFCQNTLSEAETRRLEELLRGNRAQQREFLACTGLHARLQWEFGPMHAPAMRRFPEAPRRASTIQMVGRFAAALAASMVMAAAIVGYFVSNQPERATLAAVARLGDTAQARWSTRPLPTGAGLHAGRLRLEAGVAEIRFESGAIAILEGPAELELVDPMRAYLHSGQVVLHVPEQAIGFQLETPRAKVVDLGTEFGVKVGDEGETDVQVYQGVVVAEFEKGDKQRLESGQAIRIDKTRPEETLFHPERFIRYLPGPDDPRGRRTPYNESRFDEVHLVPAPRNVVIDGDLSDWDLSGRFRSACEAPYTDNYWLEGAMMYDDQYLYVAAHVGDPFPLCSQVSPREERRLYGHGGCVALRISTDRAMGWPLEGEHVDARKKRPASPHDVSAKLVFVVLWYHQPGNEACLHLQYGMDNHGRRVNPPGYRGAWRKDKTGRGYFVEYAIPWSLLSAADDPPRGGDTLGACWLVHWSDGAGREWKGQLIDVVNPDEKGWNFHRAATWGRAIYHKKGNLPAGTVKPRSPLTAPSSVP